MQQVGLRAAASPIVIDPRRRTPLVQRRRSPHVLAHANRFWVLHRQLLLRAIAGLACALLIAVTFQARGGIAQAMTTLSIVMQGEFAEAGLGVSEITISGQALTRERDIVLALGVDERTSILNFDAEAARQRLLELPAIAEASVRKVYPNEVIITLSEKQPVARWRIDGVTFVIDAAGDQIGDAQAVDAHLPLVIGDGAADDAVVITRALQLYPDIATGLAALSRIADRRWDLIYESGLRVQLPETGVAQALLALDGYQKDHQLLERDLRQIDLRVNGVLAVRPVVAPSPLNTAAS